jgi:hypothetical protein
MNLLQELLDRRYRFDERPSWDGPGVYAYFLVQSHALSPISTDASGLVYVGMSESNLDARCHFSQAHSGFSTLRRSIGAVLKQQLALRAVPLSVRG